MIVWVLLLPMFWPEPELRPFDGYRIVNSGSVVTPAWMDPGIQARLR